MYRPQRSAADVLCIRNDNETHVCRRAGGEGRGKDKKTNRGFFLFFFFFFTVFMNFLRDIDHQNRDRLLTFFCQTIIVSAIQI